MGPYEDVLIPMVNSTFYIFLSWIVAAWLSSHAARRKTRGGLKFTALLGLASMLVIVVLNVWRLWVMIPIFQRGLGLLSLNYAASIVLLLLPVLLMLIWGTPPFWKAIRTSQSNADGVETSLRATLTAPEFTVPFQLGLSGALLALFAVVSRTSIERELVLVSGWLVYGAWRWSRQSQLQTSVNASDLAAIPPFWPRLARRSGLVLSFAAAIGAIAGVEWWNSYVPGEYSMNMVSGGHVQMPPGAAMRNLADIKGPADGKPDRSFTLVAQKTMVKLDSGDTIEAFTYNGQVPGPELRARQGEVVEVTLQNRDVNDGVTIHWHGINVPNAEDGVAGLTQDAVMPGETYVYRFRVPDSGTYWYHSHQHSLEQVTRGLFGAFIVEPRDPQGDDVTDVVVPIHFWQIPGENPRAVAAIGTATTMRRTIAPGTKVRLRLINADIERHEFNVTGSSFRVSAIDGVDIHEPETLDRARMVLAAGGRYDLQFTMPAGAVRVSSMMLIPGVAPIPDSFKAAVVLAPDETADIAAARPLLDFNPAEYGKSVEGTVNLQSHFDREYKFTFETSFGFRGRAFDIVYMINGLAFPDVPPIMVREGELIKITLVNRWFEAHPIHPHGHRMLVLSRNGRAVHGSPWWTDTLNVDPGETYEVALKADNPGIWMDHCHNLFHAGAGMVMHLMYDNVQTPFVAGLRTRNNPE